MARSIELVMTEAASRGLRIERLTAQSRRHAFDKRLLLVEGKRCQVIPSRIGHPSAEYPYAEYLPLYLPRTDWPDFLIYVSLIKTHPVFHIVPRAEMSKDTGRTPESLEPYRDAWELLQLDLPVSEKDFEILSWQLQTVKRSAQNAGLEVEFIKTKKHEDGRQWPPVIKRRILIAGKKCAIFSATRFSQDPETPEYNYAIFKVPEKEWPEFQLYVVKGLDQDVFVIPCTHLTRMTSASLDHPELARYKNAWSLLTATPEALAAVPPIQWREPTLPPPPTKHSIILQEVIRKAESQGLHADSAQGVVSSHKGVQSFLYLNKRPCQVMQASVISIPKGNKTWRYVPLNRPKSEWPQFLIFCASQFNESADVKYYVIPREMITRQTSRSVESKWLKEFEEAWHLLR